jgi:hypothetical protein
MKTTPRTNRVETAQQAEYMKTTQDRISRDNIGTGRIEKTGGQDL